MKFFDAFAKQPKLWLLIEVFLFLAAVAFADAVTDYKISWFALYALPIFLVAFSFGQRAGISFALFSAIISLSVNLRAGPYQNDIAGFSWHVVNRLVAFLFVAICGASISRFRQETRKRLEALEHAQKLEHEIVRVGDREQMRIGQDLHDGVCQSLAALDCATECLKVELENAGSPQAVTAQQIQKLLKETTVEARNLARGLVPVAMEPDGLVTALRSLVATTGALRHARVDFESHGEVALKDADVATHLYRIAQEALSNAMRHANATRVNVSVAADSDALHIRVSDDGQGSSAQPRSNGMGWRTMRYRAKLIGARIRVETPPAGGTTVWCSLPNSAMAPA